MGTDGGRPRPVELLLFHTRPRVVVEATAAGVDGFIVDWERRGKAGRQLGQGTQINHDTLADLKRVRRATGARVLCRINQHGTWTRREVNRAIDAGADELLLPMVTRVDQVDDTLAMVDGRCGLGILIETQAAVRATADLAARPLSRIYVGFNDLRIDRCSTHLFEPLVDGTIDYIADRTGSTPLGFAGLTLPDRGAPIPSRLLAAEIVRSKARFTFLRRSFLADTADGPLEPAISAIHAYLERLMGRPVEAAREDREELLRRLLPRTRVTTA